MLRHIIKRLLLGIPVVIVISFLVFMLIHFIPGDPISAMYGTSTPTQEQIDALNKLYHFDKPVLEQYRLWFSNLLRGDWGESYYLKGPVLDAIRDRCGNTIVLCVFSLLVSVVIAFPFGIRAAVKNNTVEDFGLTLFALIMLSVPSFFLGTIMVILFSVNLGWFPATGYVSISKGLWPWLRSIIMPSLALGGALSASTMRFLRSSVLDVLSQDYITLARAKGNSERRVLWIHTLRNALIPVVTHIGLQVSIMLGGSVVIERVFMFPGLGMLMTTALQQRDYPLIQGCIMLFCMMVIIVNIVVDILYSVIDPRIARS